MVQAVRFGMSQTEVYTLMCMDIPLLDIEIDLETGSVLSVSSLRNMEYWPVGTGSAGRILDWYNGRRIPASRKHLADLRDATKSNIDIMLKNSLALSLSDSFWIKPKYSELTWAQVNFYVNDFTDDVGEFLVNGDGHIRSLVCPSNTTDGMFPKKWVIIDGFRVLAKQGERRDATFDDLNEIFASKIAHLICKKKRIPFTDYFRLEDKLCGCFGFIREGENLVSAYRYLMSENCNPEYSPGSDCYYTLCEPFGRDWVDAHIILDYIIFNIDRHYNNFGFKEDALTKNLLAPAPLFDSGNSVYRAIYLDDLSGMSEGEHGNYFKSRPFAPLHDTQIKYANVKNFSEELGWVYTQIEDIFYGVYRDAKGLSEKNLTAMCRLLRRRLDVLTHLF